MLFDPIRDSVKNITEIGLAQGQSLQASRKYVGAERGSAAWHSQSAPLVAQVWHDYFENAQIWGVDIHMGVIKHARKLFRDQPRVHVLHASSKNPENVAGLGLTPATMDIVRRASLHWTDPRHSARGLLPACDSFSVRRLLRCVLQGPLHASPRFRHRRSQVVDDGDHFPPVMEKTLHLWWPYVRPGGFYCIEDVRPRGPRCR